MTRTRLAKFVLTGALAAWLALSTGAVYLLTLGSRVTHAVVSMGLGLVLLWIVGIGGLLFLFRERIRRFVLHLPGAWALKFFLFAALLALTEEAVTTGMTNLAPLFGVAVGQAYITASADYLDVVLHHSVIVFLPWFAAWAWILRRWDFAPFWVFLLTGLNGLLAETLTFGPQHLSEFALWIFVYGWMIYLPAYSIPPADKRGARPARAWHALPAFLLPFLVGVPWVLLVNLAFPNHPSIHFPPIQP